MGSLQAFVVKTGNNINRHIIVTCYVVTVFKKGINFPKKKKSDRPCGCIHAINGGGGGGGGGGGIKV